MVKTKRNQCTFHKSVYPCSSVSGFHNHSAYSINTLLHDRPNIEHCNTNQCICKPTDDWNKSCTSKEGKYLWKFNFVELIVKCRYAESYNNTTENTHLQGCDATYRSGCTTKHCICTAMTCDHR